MPHLLRDVATPQQSTPEDPEAELLGRIALVALLETLAPEDRDLLILRFWHNRKWEEIGEEIGMKYDGKPLGGPAMRHRKDRLFAELRERLAE